MAKKLDPQRLHLMELLLRWEGQVGNSRLRHLLGLSSIRASQWIREFREYQPSWTLWNSVSRTFNATPEFYRNKNADESGSLAKYLSLVGLPTASDAESLNVVVTAFSDITIPNAYIFSLLSNAARMKMAVEVTYRSMRDPLPHKRIISPHTIIRAGRRWHVRAYCELNKQFRDYTLGRISHAAILDQPAGALIGDDKDWATEIPVKLIAHPGLTQEQQSVICFEYFKDTSSRTTTIRVPLVNYYIQDVRAAVDIKTQVPPEYQLAVGNLKEIEKWLF